MPPALQPTSSPGAPLNLRRPLLLILRLLQLRVLHQQGQSESSKVMCCLAVGKWFVKLCHNRRFTDVYACLHREMANGCGGSSPPANAGVMDDVTKSPCEGAMHRLQMLRQVSCPQVLCRSSAAA